MGTPTIAVDTLEELNSRYDVVGVVTVPDKPQGRGLKLMPSPVKSKALELGIEVLQPESLKDEDFIATLKGLKPDVIVVFAFRYLPKSVYSVSKLGTFNVHTSLLPKYRGAAPINWAVIKGEVETGLTAFLLDDTIDTGDIICKQKVLIPRDATAGELESILSGIAPDFAVKCCRMLGDGEYTLMKQKEEFQTVAPKIYKQTARIDWKGNAIVVRNFINGFSPHPCAWTTFNDEQIKLYSATLPDLHTASIPKILSLRDVGEFRIIGSRLFVNCGVGVVEILELQLNGKKRVKTADFINGYRGEKFGLFV
jgi:methionyl-tRNA formyltransferase